MSIGFFTISNVLNSPIVATEFDGSGANPGSPEADPSMLIGQMLSTGSATANQVYQVDSEAEAIALFGKNSQLSQMFSLFRLNNPSGQVCCIGVADNVGGTAAAGSITWTGTATESRELVLYYGGRRVAVPVTSGDSAATIETNAVAAFVAEQGVEGYVASSAANGGGTGVDFTALHKGTIGNDIVLGHSQEPNEHPPAGLTLTVTQMTGGATDPSYTAAIAALADTKYGSIVVGCGTPTVVSAVVTVLDTRWTGTSDKDGHLFFAASDSRANLTTLGNSYNSAQATLVGHEVSARMLTPWENIAGVAGAESVAFNADPTLGAQTVKVLGLRAPQLGTEFTWAQRDTIISDGVSTLKYGRDGSVFIDRMVTTYQTNSASVLDRSLQDLFKKRGLSYFRSFYNQRMSAKYGRTKLVKDGVAIPPGQKMVNPSILKQEAVAIYGELCDLGIAQDVAAFKKAIVVELATTQANRVNLLLPVEIVQNLLFIASRAAYR